MISLDHLEEQQNEIEALRSIYYDEFQDDDESGGFRILIRQDNEDHADEEDEGEEGQEPVFLYVKYTPKYPEELPEFELEGLEQEDQEALMGPLMALANESLGMAMVFSLASFIKEWLDEMTAEREAEKLKQEEERRRALEEAEHERTKGTPVTRETFLLWKAKFDQELLQLNAEEIQKAELKRKKLSGRQLFEMDLTLATSDANYIDEGDVDVDEALFENELEDLDLEDDEDDEEVANMLRAVGDN